MPFKFWALLTAVLVSATVLLVLLLVLALSDTEKTENNVFEAKVESFELKTFQVSFGGSQPDQNRSFFLIKFGGPVKVFELRNRSLSPESQEFLVDLDNQTGYRGQPKINYVEILKALDDHKPRKWQITSNYFVYITKEGNKDWTVTSEHPVISEIITELAVLNKEQGKK